MHDEAIQASTPKQQAEPAAAGLSSVSAAGMADTDVARSHHRHADYPAIVIVVHSES